jgi:predicted MFS family arabinose efflux permease
MPSNTDEKVASPILPWFYLFLVFFTYFLAGFNTYRLQPILPTVMETLNVDVVSAGGLISSATFLNIFLTLPVGLFIAKIGIRVAGLLSIILLLIGSIIGSFLVGYTPVIIAQAVAGIGNVFVVVSGPVFISLLFSRKGHSTAMGIFTSALTAAQFATFTMLPNITVPGNINPAWRVSLVLILVDALLWLVFVNKKMVASLIKKQETLGTNNKDDEGSHFIRDTLKNMSVWQLSIGLFFFMLCAIGVLGYLPSYLVTERGMELSRASLLCSFNALLGLICAIGAGVLADRFKTHKWIYLGAVLVMSSMRFLQPTVPMGIFLFAITILQGVPAAGPGMVFSAVTSLVKNPKQKSIATSIVMTGFLCGTALGPLFFGSLVRSLGYTTSFYILIPLCLLGLIGMLTVKGVK